MAIIERERELQREKHTLRSCLSKVGQPGAQILAVTGLANSGKTTLLRAIASEYDDWLVLWAGCLPLESQIPFGVVYQWFAGLVRVSAVGEAPFDGPGGVIRDLVVSGSHEVDPATISYAMRWVVARLSERQKVLLVVDDLQWADAGSAAAIGHGLSLFSPEPVALFCSVRESAAGAGSTPLATPLVGAILHAATVVSLRASSLTAAELRVATLAASGMTNRNIAARLYITQKTVEFHLSKSFRKLGVNRRHELVEALEASQADAAQADAALV